MTLSVRDGAWWCRWPEADACARGVGRDEVSVNVSSLGTRLMPLTFSLMNKDSRLHLLSLQDPRPGGGRRALAYDLGCGQIS